MSIRAFFSCLGRMIWRAPRVLWVCRVPAISAIGGGLFVASLAQTRDMLARSVTTLGLGQCATRSPAGFGTRAAKAPERVWLLTPQQ
jgi:hypothetical protein